MTVEELQTVKQALLSSRRVRTDAGEVEERSVNEIAAALKIIERLEMKEQKRAALSRVGRYARRFD